MSQAGSATDGGSREEFSARFAARHGLPTP